MNEKELNIELFENIRKLSRQLHPQRPPHEMHGPMGRPPVPPEGMFHPEGMTPEGRHPGCGPRPRRSLPRERILTIVNEHPEGIRQREIAEILMINPSSLSEAIDKLESDRYIERNVDPSDRRATLITLSEKGKARACEVEDERNEMLAKFFERLSEEEKLQLNSILKKLIDEKVQPE